MAKQIDVSKLFQEKFESFELDNSANIAVAMKKKLQIAQYWHIFKWISGIIVVASIGFLLLLPQEPTKGPSIIKQNEASTLMESPEKQEIAETPFLLDETTETIIAEKVPEKQYKTQPAEMEASKFETILIKQNDAPKKVNNIVVEEIVLVEINRSTPSFLTTKTNLIEINKPASPLFSKTVNQLKPADLVIETKKKIKPRLAKTKDPLPFKGLSNFIAYGELNMMPFLFQNTITTDLPINDTIVWSQVEEKPRLSYQLGIGFRLQKRSSPWFVQSGLNYHNFKEKVDYNFRREYIDHELSYWDYDSIYEYHIDPPNFDTVLVGVDSSYMEHWVKTENTKTNINSYTYLNIPLLIGYHFQKDNKALSFQVSTGIGLSVLLQNTGYLYNDYGQITNYSSVVTKPVLSWSLLLNTTLNYEFKKGNTLFIRPSFQYQLDKTDIIDQPQQRKYFVYGLNFGYRIRIF